VKGVARRVPHVEQELLFTCLSGVCVVHAVKLHVFTFIFPLGGVLCDFREKTMYDSS
jgi:hypothetical protein